MEGQQGGGSPEPQEKNTFDEMMAPLLMKMYGANLAENCLFVGVQAYVVGGLLGFAFGSFFAGTGPSSFSPMAPTGTEALGWKAQTVEGIKHMGRSGVSMAKGFAVVGGLFAASECVVEKHRGRSDLWNSAIAGCFSGGVLGVRAGAMATGLGCVGFSAFSVAIDYFLGDH